MDLGEMVTHHWWDYLTIVACAVGMVACFIFIVAYVHRTGCDWTKSPYGRYLMTRKVLLGALYTLILVNWMSVGQTNVPDTWPGQGMVTALLMVCFSIQTFVPYRLLVKAQEEAQRNRRHDDRPGANVRPPGGRIEEPGP
jgi:hypothetical protein